MDKPYLEDTLKLLAGCKDDSNYLLFPEGTDLSANNLKKSNAFGEELRKYTLHPRTTGWQFMQPRMKETVVDVTMAYVDYVKGDRPSEKIFINGRFPKCITFYLGVYESSDSSEVWIKDRFAEKEALLKKVYEHGKEPVGLQSIWPTLKVRRVFSCLLFWMMSHVGFCYVVWYSSIFRYYVLCIVCVYTYFTNMQTTFRLDTWILKKCAKCCH